MRDNRTGMAIIVFAVSLCMGSVGLVLGIYVENNRMYNKCTSVGMDRSYAEVVDICKRAVK